MIFDYRIWYLIPFEEGKVKGMTFLKELLSHVAL